MAVTSFTREAQHLLRDPGHVSWSIVVLLAFAFYVYAVEVERGNWNAVLAGLAFWLMDWANEVGLLEGCPQLLRYLERMYARPQAPLRIAAALASINT